MKIKPKCRVNNCSVHWLPTAVLTIVILGVGVQPTIYAANLSTDFAVVETGGNYRIWQNATPVSTNNSGQVLYATNSVTELATGMNFPLNGQWTPSTENIQITPYGGAATNGQHQVNFAANINTSNAVQITTPEGLQLQTTILGMSFYDTSTGNNALFAALTNSTGQLVAPNQVVYSNAFTDCDADVLYTYRRSGMEQDVVIQQQLPSPTAYNLNPSTTWLQVWTEFINPLPPVIENLPNGAGERLDFGIMKMEQGKAFIFGNQSDSIPVIKQWTTIQGRTFLIEEVPLNAIAPQLQTLPTYSGGGGGNGALLRVPLKGFPKNLPPLPKLANLTRKGLKLASAPVSKKGLVLDYSLENGSITNLTFQGDTTYFITGNVNLYGTTTIEGGTVIKFTNSSPSLIIYGPVNCGATSYLPAIFTAKDDNTVGQTITGSTGTASGYYAGYALDYECSSNAAVLQHLRISFAHTAFEIDSPATNLLKHSQFVNDNSAIQEGSSGTLNVENALFCNVGQVVYCSASTTNTFNGINLTADQVGQISVDISGLTGVNFTNSLFASVTNSSTYNTTASYTNLTDPGVFQAAGAGNYYLADASPYRDVGTTNIDPALLNDLANMTTYPPITPATFTAKSIPAVTVNTTLYPQALRDYDTPDLGYHYDPIDYMTTCDYSNCVLTLTNGVVIGYWQNTGILLDNNSQLVSQGSPLQRNIIAYYSLVQEQPTKLMGGDTNLSDYPANALPFDTKHSTSGQDPSLSLRFTSVYVPQVENVIMNANSFIGGTAINTLTMRDCETYGSGSSQGYFWYIPTGQSSIINNLFQYTQVNATAGSEFDFYNNLYRGTSSYEFQVAISGFTFINVLDNAFDATTANFAETSDGYNAFLNGAVDDDSVAAGDIFTNLTWVTGPLGNFYQATSSPLINAGNGSATAQGLYHYTVTTNEVPETNSTVDIGYHYVALGTNGLPLDSNGDGIPDYLEDLNGNGTYNAGTDLANWQGTAKSDINGIAGLQVFTPLR
jgi:hypothetical protein